MNMTPPSQQFRSLLLRILDDRFARFLLIGLLNTCVSYAIYAALVLIGLDPVIALSISFCLGVGFNFVSTGRVVFSSTDVWRFPRFVLVYAIVYVANLLLLKMFLSLGLHALVAQALSLPAVAVGTFLLLRFFVFRK
jgi:putative flippase GtrA